MIGRVRGVCARLCRLAAIASLCSACAPREADLAAPQPLPALRHVPIGLCEDYPEESRSLAGAREDFELLRRLGIDTLRVSFGWDSIEPERDRYDLDFWDAFVQLAVDEYHLTLLPYVAYTPAWSSGGGDETYWKTPPRDPADFAQVMGLLAARYQGRIRSWELWNEPDNRDYWLGSAEDYSELARAGAEAVHAVDPTLAVVSGGLAGDLEFLAALFDDFDGARSFDVVNLHAYFETWNPEPTETLTRYVADAEHIVQRHGGEEKLWMAEIGYGNHRDGPRVSAYTSAVFAYEHTLEYQAVTLVKSLALLLASPVSLIAWYELKDPPAGDAMIGDVNNRHLGVTFGDRRPKPAARALTFFARLLAGGFRAAPAGLRMVSRTPSGDARARAFLTARRTLVIVAWLATPARPPAPPALGDAADPRRELLWVHAPYRALGAPTLHDAVGRPRPAPRQRGDGPAIDFELELRGGEVLVAELGLELAD